MNISQKKNIIHYNIYGKNFATYPPAFFIFSNYRILCYRMTK